MALVRCTCIASTVMLDRLSMVVTVADPECPHRPHRELAASPVAEDIP